MDHHHTARVLAAMRIAIGAVAFVAPGLSTRPLFRDSSPTAPAKVLTRVFAVRDIALGVGTLRALRENRDPQSWTRLGALCDAGDVAAMTLAIGKLPLAPSVVGIASAATAAASGWRASTHLDSSA